MKFGGDSPELDAIDLQIINLLQEHGRIPLVKLGEQVGLSAPSVNERVKKLEDGGVIIGYHATVDATRLGKDVTAFIGVSIAHPKTISLFEESVALLDDVLECHHVTGQHTLMLKIKTENTSSLERLISTIRSIEGVARTETMVVLSTHTERGLISLHINGDASEPTNGRRASPRFREICAPGFKAGVMMHNYRSIPKAQGLYDPAHEHDACGVGFVVNIKGERSHDIVAQGLAGARQPDASRRVRMRSAHRRRRRNPAADSARVFRDAKRAARLRTAGARRVRRRPGVPAARRGQAQSSARTLFERIVSEEGQRLLGWRDVPVVESACGDIARRGMPLDPPGLHRARLRLARCRGARAQAVRHSQARDDRSGERSGCSIRSYFISAASRR